MTLWRQVSQADIMETLHRRRTFLLLFGVLTGATAFIIVMLFVIKVSDHMTSNYNRTTWSFIITQFNLTRLYCIITRILCIKLCFGFMFSISRTRTCGRISSLTAIWMWWGGRTRSGNACAEGKLKYGRHSQLITNKEYKYLLDYAVTIRNRAMIVEIALKWR